MQSSHIPVITTIITIPVSPKARVRFYPDGSELFLRPAMTIANKATKIAMTIVPPLPLSSLLLEGMASLS